MNYLDGTAQGNTTLPKPFHGVITKPAVFHEPENALTHVCNIYNNHVARLRLLAESDMEITQDITYPYVGIYVPRDQDGLLKGCYGTTISHPEVLYDYYQEQFRTILEEHRVPIWIGHSTYPMSLTFIDEELFNRLAKNKLRPSYLPCMKRIQTGLNSNGILPLSAFHGERTGYSLNRLHHYCGTDARFFQNTVIFANYDIYAKYFIDYAKNEVLANRAECLVGPGMYFTAKDGLVNNSKIFNPQMPAYHLVRPNRNGITLINVNVGPSNVKTITDHVAVLRSHRWIMLGHCAGLRYGQKIGDYVLSQVYVRYDYVLDNYVPKHVPIPASTYLTKLFVQIAANKTKAENSITLGTVVTTRDRNWELNPSMVDEFSDAKATAIDMESATVATNAFRFGVDSIAFLRISDKPLHGEPKIRTMAQQFYKDRVEDHFRICVEVCEEAILHGGGSRTKDDSLQYPHYSGVVTPFR